MKLDDFEIRFSNHRGVYSAGSCVDGHVVLKLTKPMKMRCIQLHFEGRAKAHWDVRQGRSKTDYRATEDYINHTVPLYGTGQGTVEHPPGLHSYPFSLQLSSDLPSSFEGRRGHVRYFCKATIHRPWKCDEHTKRAFTVIHHLDLNIEPTAGMPVWGEQEELVEGCCCSSGKVRLRMTLDKTGYVPGEPLNFMLDITNQSDVEVSGVQVELQQIVKYTGYSDSIFSSGHPKFHTKMDNYSLYAGQFSVKRHSEGHLSHSACIPALPPSRLDGCGIIDVLYIVCVQPKMKRSSLKLEKEILIGTVPLQADQAQMSPLNNITMDGFISPTAPPLDTGPPPYQDPPPTYEESVFGHVQIRDENDDVHTEVRESWAPSYPYYHWDPTTRHFQMIATVTGSPQDSTAASCPANPEDANTPCPPYSQL